MFHTENFPGKNFRGNMCVKLKSLFVLIYIFISQTASHNLSDNNKNVLVDNNDDNDNDHDHDNDNDNDNIKGRIVASV